MGKILEYIHNYILWVHKGVLLFSALFTGAFIFINYSFDLNGQINTQREELQFLSWYLVFLLSFSFGYLLVAITKKSAIFKHPQFLVLMMAAPAIFAWKMSFSFSWPFSADALENIYWNRVVYWPFKLLVMVTALLAIWRIVDRQQHFYGVAHMHFSLKPYLLMLLIMVPLIAAASTQPDFLAMYPKFKGVAFLTEGRRSGWYKFLYELSYGSDFVGIELFFRGFLVLAFVKWAGKDAILPMAIFYCTIHFGKPLGECISSFFGGIILGVVTYHTRSILGGLIVHLGIAWLMELGGYVGRGLNPDLGGF